MSRARLGALLAFVVIAATCCGGSDDAEEAAPAVTTTTTTTAAPATTAAPVTTTTTIAPPATTTMAPATTTTAPPPTTAAPPATTTAPVTTTTTAPATTTTAPPPEWEMVAGGENCACADGSPYFYWVREADPTKLVIYLEGGGACFTWESCSFTDGNYDSDVDPDDPAENPANAGGIFGFDNPLNPLRDHSFVVIPYCTGDIHLGNKTYDYGGGRVVRHNGFVNANTALDEAVQRFGDATDVVVAGTSAGSAAAALYGGLAADHFADAAISVVADASGAYPSVPAVNATIGGLWGTTNAIPDWPVNEGLTAAQWGLPELFIQAGTHAPRIRFARFDNAFDSTQEFFAGLAGFNPSNMDQLMAQNETRIENAGIDQASYTAPGTGHGILPLDLMYTLEVEGVAFLDWLSGFLSGDDVADVTCVDCS